MRHDTFTTVPEPAFRTDATDHAHDVERRAWHALADGDREAAAAHLDDAAAAHAHDAGLPEAPDFVNLTLRGGAYRAAVCARIARELRGVRDRTDRGKPPAVALHITAPGWSLDYPPYQSGSLSYGSGSLSGYGDDWTAHIHELAPDALVIDKRACTSWEELSRLAVSGPMPGAEVPAGMRDSLSAGIVPWNDRPTVDRDPRFGDARSFDRVALDVYVTIAERFGARVFTVAELLTDRPDFATTTEARDRMAVA